MCGQTMAVKGTSQSLDVLANLITLQCLSHVIQLVISRSSLNLSWQLQRGLSPQELLEVYKHRLGPCHFLDWDITRGRCLTLQQRNSRWAQRGNSPVNSTLLGMSKKKPKNMILRRLLSSWKMMRCQPLILSSIIEQLVSDLERARSNWLMKKRRGLRKHCPALMTQMPSRGYSLRGRTNSKWRRRLQGTRIDW